ncbi:MAG TPA: hypothetical protein PLG90_07545 [Ignavibacteria bacterium]|nr:hypothetical protein [Ignavibacteria bacterium]
MNIKLVSKLIKISEFKKKFDFVSIDESVIGDAKFFGNDSIKNNNTEVMSKIAESVWLLEKTKAENKFLIFGGREEIPNNWLKKFINVTNIKFYYLNEDKIKELNKTKNKIDEIYSMSVWDENDLKNVNEVRESLNKWNPEKF